MKPEEIKARSAALVQASEQLAREFSAYIDAEVSGLISKNGLLVRMIGFTC